MNNEAAICRVRRVKRDNIASVREGRIVIVLILRTLQHRQEDFEPSKWIFDPCHMKINPNRRPRPLSSYIRY